MMTEGLSQAVQVNLKYAEGYYHWGHVRYSLKDYQGAVEDFSQAIRFHPNYASAYYKRGITYRQIGNKQAALEDFQSAANLYQKQGRQTKYETVLEAYNQLRQQVEQTS